MVMKRNSEKIIDLKIGTFSLTPKEINEIFNPNIKWPSVDQLNTIHVE